MSIVDIEQWLSRAQVAIDYTIQCNQMDNGMFHAYNLLSLSDDSLDIDHLYPMLEGQVAALSSGYLSAAETNRALASLFASDVYRADQKTFMLYPDRALPSFLNKNVIPAESAQTHPLIEELVTSGMTSIVEKDVQGTYRFHSSLTNKDKLNVALSKLPERFHGLVKEHADSLHTLYELVFNHKAFTGRSGGMFGFEGLGCIYWHMVSKLLLAVQECYFNAIEKDEPQEEINKLAAYYYQVREGIGFNKTPEEYGAFPVDPYSHTPGHSGAQQPGMTGQVKEEVLTRFGELGIRVNNGKVAFEPSLLRQCEFLTKDTSFRYLDVNNQWQTIELVAGSLAFTWCQVPIIYILNETEMSLTLKTSTGHHGSQRLTLDAETASNLFGRTGHVKQITVHLTPDTLTA